MADRDGLTVRGGVGSFHVTVEGIVASGDALARIGQDVGGFGRRVGGMSAVLSSAPLALLALPGRLRVELAIGRAALGLGTLAARAQALGVTAWLAARGYLAAEAAVSAAMRGLADQVAVRAAPFVVVGLGAGVAAGAARAAIAGEPDPWRSSAAHTARAVGDWLGGPLAGWGDTVAGSAVPFLAGALTGPAAPVVAGALPTVPLASLPLPVLAAVVVGVSATLGGPVPPRRAGLTPAASARSRLSLAWRRAEPPAGVAEVFATTSRQGAGMQVTVDRVRGPGGRTAWIVHIPGTVGDADPANARGFGTNLLALARLDNAMLDLVRRAMAEARIGPGDPVLLSGYSQGGMIAAQAAADPRIGGRYRVTGVVTAGSPVGHYRLPDGVRGLSLENDHDAVPWLDGTRNPDTSRWTTVGRKLGSGAEGAAGVLAGHGAEHYRETARLVDRSGHPSVVAWREANPWFFAPGAEARRRVFTAGARR